MRLLCSLAILVLTTFVHAAQWQNDLFGVSANLPDSPGWAPIPAENTAALSVLIAMQNPQKQTVFGVNVVHDVPNSNLRDPATLQKLETLLRGFGYQWIGRSTVQIGGREWVQFPVKALNNGQVMSGVIRYTSANNQVYAVSLLKGGGQEAAQDTELQAAAASVRISAVKIAESTPEPAPADSAVAQNSNAPNPNPAVPTHTEEPAPKTQSEDKTDNSAVMIGPVKLTRQTFNLILYSLGGLVVLLILLKLIGGGKSSERR